jgi:hypothetical protein
MKVTQNGEDSAYGKSGKLDLSFMRNATMVGAGMEHDKRKAASTKAAKAKQEQRIADAYREGLLDMHYAMQEGIETDLGPGQQDYALADQMPFTGLPAY